MKGVLIQPTQQQRVIRVFISSTFQDMKQEREELVKRVFPQLRKMCEKRGVVWGEVDLRWGITDEQKAEGKVLPICLREIHECRPYFIGILGERYGWVPLEIPGELIEQEPWLAEHREKSVTELEILHGVLNNPEMADHAYFYVRDPAYIESLQRDEQTEAREEPTHEEVEELGAEEANRRAADRRERLARLKDRIRGSGLPVRDDYKNPKQLGELALEDLTAVIDRRFPEGTELGTLDREAMEHEAFAQAKHRIYIGRKEYFDRLDEHVEGDAEPLVVLGESGLGKSALLANWVVKYRDEHPDELVIVHFIGSTPYSSDWAAMLRRIMGEFKRRFDIQEEIPSEPGKLRQAFANWLHMAAARGRVVLILDALNQLEDRDNAPDLVWLPPFVPESIRLVLSTLPGRPLDDLKKRDWPTMEVEPLVDEEREQLIRDYLAQYRKTLSKKRVEKIASAERTRNPLYLRSLLEELRVLGEHERLDERIEYYLSAESTPELYERIFERCEGDYERDRPRLVRDALTLLWASRRGLSETELLDVLGKDGEPLPQAIWAPFYIAADKMFVSRSGLIGFSHDYQRQAIQDRYLPAEDQRSAAHLRLADYFAEQELGPRNIDELPWQLAEAEAWQGLNELLADLEFFSAAWEKDQFEIRAYWMKVENSSELSLLDAYQSVLDAPEKVPDDDTVMHVSNLLKDTSHPSEALSLIGYLSEFYRSTGEQKKLATSLRGQGNILQDRGEYESALKLYRESEQIFRELGDRCGLSRSLNSQGAALWRRGDVDGAMKICRESERICRELGDERVLSNSLCYQGLILWHRNDFDGAMKLFKEHERICRELGDKSGLSSSLNNQGIILYHRGDYDGAMKLYREQEHICRELGDKGGLSSSLNNQGIILKNRGDLDGAMKLYKEKERICRELGDKRGLSISLNNQGDVFKELGELDKAMNILKKAESISREIGIPYQVSFSLAQQADVLLRKDQPEKALPLAEEAYEIATKHDFAEQIELSKSILDNIRSQLD